jgi:putative glutathione S-transferase
MGLLVDGVWKDQDHDTKSTGGRFERPQTVFRNWVTADGSAGPTGEGGFPAAAGRYHLYVALACPWAHRTLIFRKLKKLEDVISVSIVEPINIVQGWEFGAAGSATADTANGKAKLSDIYLLATPGYTGRVTVPVLWDKERRTIVNNESAEIIRMLNSAFARFTDVATDYYPAPLRDEIDAVNRDVYTDVNNGVYRAGFATTQGAYEEAFLALFARLDALEAHLARRRLLVGDRQTEADWRLFTSWCASTPYISATSSATCAASSTIRISRTICATSTRRRASPRPSISTTSSATITAATAASTRPASSRSAQRSTSPRRTTAGGSTSPTLRHRRAHHDLGDAGAHARHRVVGQRVAGEEAVGENLVVGLRRRRLAEGGDDVERDVVALRHPRVEINRMQRRLFDKVDVALLLELAGERIEQRFSGLDAAAGQVPAAHISVLDEEDAAALVDDKAAHPERQSARQPPIEMEAAPDRRLEGAADGLNEVRQGGVSRRHAVHAAGFA